MAIEVCCGYLSFIPLDAGGPKIFGFPEFLTGLALMILAWTIADTRYRFRINSAPFAIQKVTFWGVTSIGSLTLITDLWRAERWLVPSGPFLTPASWQALLGGAFLLTILTWAWIAFIHPPVFGRRTAKPFALALYRYILKGAPSELAVIADELAYSAKQLVRYAPKQDLVGHRGRGARPTDKQLAEVEGYANDLLLLIADRCFCSVIVESSPGTALAIFQEMSEREKYSISVGAFASNIMSEAITNKNSFLFRETNGYKSGLLGYHKPLSHAMFSNHAMVEAIGTIFDIDILWSDGGINHTQLKAYTRSVLLTFDSYIKSRTGSHSFVLHRALSHFNGFVMDLYKINGNQNISIFNDSIERLHVVVDFIKESVSILDKYQMKPYCLRLRGEIDYQLRTYHDKIADLFIEIIHSASAVKAPRDLCWSIQHNAIWAELFSYEHLDSVNGRAVKFKIRRLVYNEILRMKIFPNFLGARLLGYCLNVMGFTVRPDKEYRDSRALHKMVVSWTKRHYAWLHCHYPRIAEEFLVDGVTYDSENKRLIKADSLEGLRRKPNHEYFTLDAVEAEDSDVGTEAIMKSRP